MPELPEVETICRRLASRLRGGVILDIDLLRPGILRAGDIKTLSRKVITAVRRLGKLVIIETGGELVIFHLKMTGNLLLLEDKQPGRHCHLVIHGLDRDGIDFFLHFHDMRRFGYLCVLPSSDGASGPPICLLGPDALCISQRDFISLLDSTRRRIKSLLLDQSKIAGIGNIYADEILFWSRINPITPSRELSIRQKRSLYSNMGKVLREAIDQGGSSVSNYVTPAGTKGSFQKKHAVYRRRGQPCPVCLETIVRKSVGGRGTYFCPACQAPVPRCKKRK